MHLAHNHLCHVCRNVEVEAVPGFYSLRRVTSDCRPWPSGGSLGVCRTCGTVQKLIDQTWRDEVRTIYTQYDLYHQSPSRTEQMVFDQSSGGSSPRSQRILQFAIGCTVFPMTGRMLDVGCGNGAMLRAFSHLAPGWELNGFEPNLRAREAVLSIPGMKEIYDSRLAEVPGVFDVISIVHALEHIENPVPVLVELRNMLTLGGHLLIEVPYFPDNPFDLLIADHCTHFTIATLLPVLAAAGLEALVMRTDTVAKEMTVLARRARADKLAPACVSPTTSADVRQAVDDALAWLQAVAAESRTIAKSGQFGLFGTSNSANWLYGELMEYVQFFIEEDPNRIGITYRERPVYHPANIPCGSNVFLALPRALAEQILSRLKPVNGRFHFPPFYKRHFVEAQYAAR